MGKRFRQSLLIFTGLLVMSLFVSVNLATATTFTVSSTLDTSDASLDGVCDDGSGNCTLRAAIEEANNTTGTDQVTIEFNISGAGPHTIFVTTSSMETINRNNVVIDGSTQPGSSCGDLWMGTAPTWNIIVSSTGGNFNGLDTTADSSTFKGLHISGFGGGNAGIDLGGDGSTVICNHLVHNDKGLRARGNNHRVGGDVAGDGNVISGSTQEGMPLLRTNGIIIQGNFIGPNPTGSVAIGNSIGINIESASSTTIGGSSTRAKNLISGNNDSGIRFSKEASLESPASTTIRGNYIGLNRAGTSALGNGGGISIPTSTSDIRIGGSGAGEGNIISGHSGLNQSGISISNGTDIVIQGNYIGTDASGTSAVRNYIGIRLSGTPSSLTIGGAGAGERNVLSGNNGSVGIGLALDDSPGSGVSIIGNYIGLNASGTAALGNSFGVTFQGTNHTLGTTISSSSNFISGNTHGVVFLSFSAEAITGNVVQGSYIGVGGDTTTAVGNTGHGVLIVGTGAANNRVGGFSSGQGNIIAYNSSSGVSTLDETGFSLGNAASGNAIVGNSIFSNGELGIDLATSSSISGLVNVNDTGDSDSGPNDFQNFPVIGAATVTSSITTVTGTLNSTASETFWLEFFSTSSTDPSGYGEGQTFLGTTTVTTDGSGDATFSVTSLPATTLGHYITMTATDSSSSTSEFSLAVEIVEPAVVAATSSSSESSSPTTVVGVASSYGGPGPSGGGGTTSSVTTAIVTTSTEPTAASTTIEAVVIADDPVVVAELQTRLNLLTQLLALLLELQILLASA